MSNCIFCKIIKGEIPGKFVYRDTSVVAIYDINPKAPIHVLIIPISHVSSLIDIKENNEKLLGHILIVAKKIAQKLNIDSNGYKIVINNGVASGQLVFHLHLHLLGGWKTVANWQV